MSFQWTANYPGDGVSPSDNSSMRRAQSGITEELQEKACGIPLKSELSEQMLLFGQLIAQPMLSQGTGQQGLCLLSPTSSKMQAAWPSHCAAYARGIPAASAHTSQRSPTQSTNALLPTRNAWRARTSSSTRVGSGSVAMLAAR